jgi:hypothetical protein
MKIGVQLAGTFHKLQWTDLKKRRNVLGSKLLTQRITHGGIANSINAQAFL